MQVEQEVELTEAEKDLGPCMCCGNPQLGRWQVVYEGPDPIGALCFDCYSISGRSNVDYLLMIEFNARFPDAAFGPTWGDKDEDDTKESVSSH